MRSPGHRRSASERGLVFELGVEVYCAGGRKGEESNIAG